MTTHREQYDRLRNLPPDERAGWIRSTYPAGTGIQWWFSVLGSAETEVSARLVRGEPADADPFAFAVSIVELGTTMGEVDPPHAAYWLVRFAAMALRFDTPPPGLPDEVTPDGSARAAIAAIPLTEEEALKAAERRSREFREGIDGPADEETRALQDLERVVSSLDRVRGHVTDPGLTARIDRWLEVYERLAPT
ncbi:hypothetical protein [Plantactinospora sp. CA-290183]|uniref:hypothetical protein n=1 Tax=Plantactinospora sp. CA-290183 TaxID=3240006 RepID=UPI003D947301